MLARHPPSVSASSHSLVPPSAPALPQENTSLPREAQGQQRRRDPIFGTYSLIKKGFDGFLYSKTLLDGGWHPSKLRDLFLGRGLPWIALT